MTDQTTAPLSPGLNCKLSTMMFLQYAIWGAWLPLLWPFLSGHRGFSADEIGTMFSIGAIGAILAPFVAGQISDRYFNTEKFLGISHILGGILVMQLAWIEGYWPFLGFCLCYSLIYSPTLSLTNSLAFHHLPSRDRDFGKVRVWGTIGWIVAGIGIGQWLLHKHTPTEEAAQVIAATKSISIKEVIAAAQCEGMADAFKLSGALGVIMGLFCFLGLPKTPPTKGKEKNATFEALGEIKKQPLLMLFILAVPISCIHQFYFVHTAGFLGSYQNETESFAFFNKIFGVGGGGLMTIGQMSEIAVLALIPMVAKKISRKTLLMVGILGYILRMALFAGVDFLPFPTALTLVLGVAMHGFCFGCFIFVAFMIVDEETSGDVRASAQSLFNLVIVGIGTIVGSMIASTVAKWATDEAGNMDYPKLFLVPLIGALVCLVVLLLGYPGKKKTP